MPPISYKIALIHEKIGEHPERKTKIKTFLDKSNWEVINCPSGKDNWKKFEKKNSPISLNILYTKKEKIYPAYVSKHNSNR